MKTLTFDIETYPNYTLFALQNIDNNKLYTFELRGEDSSLTDKQITKLNKLLTKNKIITFNGIKFDEPITAMALFKNYSAFKIFKLVQSVIVDKLKSYTIYRTNNLRPFIKTHYDIMDVAIGIASLKLYGARLGTKKLQDLPYEPSTYLTNKQMGIVRSYCENDLILTEELYYKLGADLELREDLSKQYNLNLISLNGANIAEKILVQESGYNGKAPSTPKLIQYTPPKYINFKTKVMKDVFKYIKEHEFLLSGNGNVELPAKLKMEKIMLGDLTFQMGIGGVHGSVENTSIYADKKHTILDIDYKALYPSLIIQNKFVPKHIGKKFLSVYKGMYDERVSVKTNMKSLKYGSEAYNKLNTQQNGLKLVNNSSFGKMGLQYSKLYDPSVLLHITLTGQLTLMMVIEKLYLKGFNVFYANTDGITLKVKTKDVDKIKKITTKFDKKTGLEMEYEEFKSCHIRDVNNFVNITADNKVKSKGAYGTPSLNKNAQTPIVFEAVRKFLLDSTSITTTINNCKNVHDFCTSRTVKGGAMYGDNIPDLYPDDWADKLASKRGLTKKIIKDKEKLEADWIKDNGVYLGKVVRWYYSTQGKSIHYKTNGNKVPKSDGAIPMMDLTNTIPKDLDYEWYYNEAIQALKDVGYDY